MRGRVLNKRFRILLALLGVGLTAVVGATIAYHNDITIFRNDFTLDSIPVTYKEKFTPPDGWKPCDEEPKEASVKNESDANLYVRMSYEEYWQAQSGLELPLTKDNVRLAVINFQHEQDWELRDDGWYYTRRRSLLEQKRHPISNLFCLIALRVLAAKMFVRKQQLVWSAKNLMIRTRSQSTI